MNADAPAYDMAIIGAGVVGCAIFREFSLAGLRVALVERGADILSGASKANSALLHTGFDAIPGSLEAACMREGHARYQALHQGLGLPLLRTGAIVVAWSPADLAALPGIVARAHDNGVLDVRQISAEDVRTREPHLADDLLGGVLVPGEAVIDAWSAPLAYARQGLAMGGTFLPNTRVTGGSQAEAGWTLQTSQGPLSASVVVNCAGNQGDAVEAIARPSPFEIRPRKGQFVVLDKTAYPLASAIILPVPNERTKGVVICRTAYGNLLVGPTAEEQQDRENATVDQAMLEGLLAQGRRMIPALAAEPVTTTYAGLRPATQFKDYQIEALPQRRWITVGGIRSTGLTGSLGIAAHLHRLYAQHFGPLPTPADPVLTPVPNLTEEHPRPWQRPGRDEIVCHCEMVTRGEIAAALQGPLPAGDLGGLKRRTRCMMGRCQGFYCTWRVMEIAAPHVPGLVTPIQGSSA
ncbi:NAD(P)/FAD-dependent oxidoreductase [Roseomonas aerophila]|uniref:NAD(P)/FAD-dependent oxidoreductase n=1 Tax=Teichococcus aerophilus TaxID=1224513 RepID=A0ABR7RJ84_9PROT|nr:NAD(P)/FAD-dependent oxidoreductase [Pseudoroseomonas aerophila]MBC9206185.1 NAD(P)/FAD-dependent oxidoreductase [Pseudoroseomonas aerophila]